MLLDGYQPIFGVFVKKNIFQNVLYIMRNRPLDEKNETTVAGVYLKKFHLSDKFLHRVSKKRRKKNENSADLANPI